MGQRQEMEVGGGGKEEVSQRRGKWRKGGRGERVRGHRGAALGGLEGNQEKLLHL